MYTSNINNKLGIHINPKVIISSVIEHFTTLIKESALEFKCEMIVSVIDIVSIALIINWKEIVINVREDSWITWRLITNGVVKR